MKNMMGIVKAFLVVLVVGFALWAVAVNYSVIFSKKVVGEVTAVEKDNVQIGLLTTQAGADLSGTAYSFVIGIKDRNTGEIFTASSEDRQWAVVQKGQCAEADYLPYPPWELTRRGTYHSARLVKLYECK